MPEYTFRTGTDRVRTRFNPCPLSGKVPFGIQRFPHVRGKTPGRFGRISVTRKLRKTGQCGNGGVDALGKKTEIAQTCGFHENHLVRLNLVLLYYTIPAKTIFFRPGKGFFC
jgi:hypothetical protein